MYERFDSSRSLVFLMMTASVAVVTACSEVPPTAAESEPVVTPAFAASQNAATTIRSTFSQPIPPIPVSAPCLDLEEGLVADGTWSWRQHIVITRNGRASVSEQGDYSDVSLRSGDLTWTAAPGATETIIRNVPADPAAPGSFVARHELHARFISQDGLPDLRVFHRIHRLFELVDGEVVHRKFVRIDFTGTCIDNGAR